MKRQKGFTLIELLAVIVILAIIALIATPMIMDVIDKARKGSVEASAYGYVQAVEDSTVYSIVDMKEPVSVGIHAVTDLNNSVDVKGEKPISGWVAVGDNGTVEAAYLQFSSYSKYVGYTPDNRANAKLTGKETFDATVIAGATDIAAVNKAKEEINALIK